jgi:hypothetical protein
MANIPSYIRTSDDWRLERRHDGFFPKRLNLAGALALSLLAAIALIGLLA